MLNARPIFFLLYININFLNVCILVNFVIVPASFLAGFFKLFSLSDNFNTWILYLVVAFIDLLIISRFLPSHTRQRMSNKLVSFRFICLYVPPQEFSHWSCRKSVVGSLNTLVIFKQMITYRFSACKSDKIYLHQV